MKTRGNNDDDKDSDDSYEEVWYKDEDNEQ